MSEKVVKKGNEAICEAAIRAGCRFFAGYPITPQTTATEYLSWRMPEAGGVFVQAESEVAAINMVAGSAMAGTRAMTATSGPGLSLMTEGLSVIAGTRLPTVIVNIQRSGAGIGSITGNQSDFYMVTKTLGHGGLTGLVYGPESIQESVDIMYESWDLAEKYRTPVIIMTDGVMGQMMEQVEMPDFKEAPDLSEQPYVAGKRKGGRKKHLIMDSPYFGPKATQADNLEYNYAQYEKVYESWDENEVRYEEYMTQDAEYLIIAWGTSARVAKTAIRHLREQDVKVGLFRPITLVPFPKKQLAAIDKNKIKGILTVEMAVPSQFHNEVMHYLDKDIRVEKYRRGGGNMVLDEEIEECVKKML
ncbi:MAG: 3-methyl-2-oxobutanoate dehydrogenase subunit beta [Eubacteriaceae bacterium]|jgi:2-oxoglutarate ferredoxin oxidoreductase subunit alpha|nr:3-methyl-2-oxobutanoate dehydrogenase subunit beta [Eubacteriaceae bacterium]